MNEGVTPNEKSLNGAWLDFYALLGVERDCAPDALRRRIGECYAEASNNCDHRDLQRRLFYQAMVERVLPQCRRVLLNPVSRERYDEQYDLHASGSLDALPYVAFMASLMGAPVAPAAPHTPVALSPVPPSDSLTKTASVVEIGIPESEFEAAPLTASSAPTAQAAWQELDYNALPERVRDEIALAREVVETLEHGFAFDLLPSRSVTTGSAPLKDAHPVTHNRAETLVSPAPTVTVRPAPPTPATEMPRPASYGVAPQAPSAVTTSQPEPESVMEAPEAKHPFKRGAWDSDEKIPRQRPEVEHIVGVVGQNGLMQDDLVFDAAKSRAQRHAARSLPDNYKPRVVLDDGTPAHIGRDDARRGKPSSAEGIVSSTARLLLTGIVAAVMMLVIQRNNTAPVSAEGNAVLLPQPAPSAQVRHATAQAKARAAAQTKARLAAQRLADQKKARLAQLQKAKQQSAIRQVSEPSSSAVSEITSSVPGTP